MGIIVGENYTLKSHGSTRGFNIGDVVKVTEDTGDSYGRYEIETVGTPFISQGYADADNLEEITEGKLYKLLQHGATSGFDIGDTVKIIGNTDGDHGLSIKTVAGKMPGVIGFVDRDYLEEIKEETETGPEPVTEPEPESDMEETLYTLIGHSSTLGFELGDTVKIIGDGFNPGRYKIKCVDGRNVSARGYVAMSDLEPLKEATELERLEESFKQLNSKLAEALVRIEDLENPEPVEEPEGPDTEDGPAEDLAEEVRGKRVAKGRDARDAGETALEEAPLQDLGTVAELLVRGFVSAAEEVYEEPEQEEEAAEVLKVGDIVEPVDDAPYLFTSKPDMTKGIVKETFLDGKGIKVEIIKGDAADNIRETDYPVEGKYFRKVGEQ